MFDTKYRIRRYQRDFTNKWLVEVKPFYSLFYKVLAFTDYEWEAERACIDHNKAEDLGERLYIEWDRRNEWEK